MERSRDRQGNLKQGQALVEVMVAVAILTVGFLGVVGLLSRALSLNRVVADNYVATYLAAEGIEITKSVIDGNIIQGRVWNQGNNIDDCGGNIETGTGGCEVDWGSLDMRGYIGQPLGFNDTTKLYDYSGGTTPTSFRRRVVVTLLAGGNEVQVESQVTWIARGGGTSEITLEDHFYNWR